MSIQKGGLRPQRGKNISLQTDRGNTATSLLNQAVKKMKDFNNDVKDGPFVLLYPDGTEVVNIPGTQKPFTVEAYKHELGRPYQRITLYICLKEDFEEVGGPEESSDSDMEVVIKTPSEFDLADTLPWEPQHESSPFSTVTETENDPRGDVFADEIQQVTNLVENGNNPRTSQCLTTQNTCYRNYTGLFEPILIEDDDPVVDLTQNKEDKLPEEPVDTHVQAHEIIAQLALAINHKKNLVNHMIGNPSFDATIEDVKDEEIGKVLHQVLEAASDESLQNIILQNSTMFQTAGCLRVVRTCEKHAFVEEYLRWYIIDRNHSCIQRFKDGLASLDFFSALEQHFSVLSPVLSYSCKALTASDIENMFIPDLSPPGSNRRQKEAKTLGFWADYLSDSEEKLTAVSLEELLMFATGLAALPPAGMTPTPQIQFTSESPFPVANTCANIMKLQKRIQITLLDSKSTVP
ncbi:hypothetical protein OJAV_G00135520 [Oryzias javanicus]|uniref:HECT domain-containing protein n=1 Tax=Oryzias javanicus TaxID=123683 RepID=A0A437CLP2_ORYJA|nr:hypothetical protein OJAV_G00135520 [Oryzias javanicus]